MISVTASIGIPAGTRPSTGMRREAGNRWIGLTFCRSAVSGELPFRSTARDILPYGVAMLLAAAHGDGDNQQLFASLYDQKRVSVRSGYERRTDTLPRGCDV